MKSYIFALDLSLSNTGVAIFDDAGKCKHLLSIDTHKELTHPLKLRKIEKALTLLKMKYNPKIIVIEESFTRFNKSTQAIYKVRGIVELLFWNIKQVFYHSTSVRKELLGKGNAKKEEVYEYLIKNYKETFANFDQSDAFAVGICYFMKEGII